MDQDKPMQWKFDRNGVLEAVEPELWRWEAKYNDGSTLKQFDDNGIFHQFGEIDQSRLFVFSMVNAETNQTYMLIFEEGMKLIHFYENYIFWGATEFEKRVKAYCFGYETKNDKRIFAIMPDGGMAIVDDIDKVKLSM